MNRETRAPGPSILEDVPVRIQEGADKVSLNTAFADHPILTNRYIAGKSSR